MKITREQINKGIRREAFAGMYQNKFDTPAQNPKINTFRSVAGGQKRLPREDVDIGKYRAETATQRGFKKRLDYNGERPMFWSPANFNPNLVGGNTYDSGAGRGGQFTTQQVLPKYKPAFGIAGTGQQSADKPMGQVNPFPIKIKASVRQDN
jgi:hypothetical protein